MNKSLKKQNKIKTKSKIIKNKRGRSKLNKKRKSKLNKKLVGGSSNNNLSYKCKCTLKNVKYHGPNSRKARQRLAKEERAEEEAVRVNDPDIKNLEKRLQGLRELDPQTVNQKAANEGSTDPNGFSGRNESSGKEGTDVGTDVGTDPRTENARLAVGQRATDEATVMKEFEAKLVHETTLLMEREENEEQLRIREIDKEVEMAKAKSNRISGRGGRGSTPTKKTKKIKKNLKNNIII